MSKINLSYRQKSRSDILNACGVHRDKIDVDQSNYLAAYQSINSIREIANGIELRSYLTFCRPTSTEAFLMDQPTQQYVSYSPVACLSGSYCRLKYIVIWFMIYFLHVGLEKYVSCSKYVS